MKLNKVNGVFIIDTKDEYKFVYKDNFIYVNNYPNDKELKQIIKLIKEKDAIKY